MKWEGSHNRQETGFVQSGAYLRKNVCNARFYLRKNVYLYLFYLRKSVI